VKFKICGLKNINSILCCEKHNVDFYGMIFYSKSPRNIQIEEAKELVKSSNDLKIKPVGVFVNQKLQELLNIISFLDLKFVQLHGEEDQNYIDELKKNKEINIIKKVSINKAEDLLKINQIKNIEYFLFDYKPQKNELPGGNSKSFDWSLLREKKINLPWFLSGGINENNIKKISKIVNPDGIDLSSGVEDTRGIKSIEKIDNLFKKFYAN
tara:strand:+ start:11214 stop:11846 length:633 start_codon:yes stop_codon:yes gene_type:complete